MGTRSGFPLAGAGAFAIFELTQERTQMNVYPKTPAARVHYSVDWGENQLGPWLIEKSEWHVHPHQNGGLNVLDHGNDGRATSVTVDGGAPGQTYDLINRIMLSNGDRDSRAISFRVEASR